MEARKTKEIRIVLFVIATLIIIYTILDAMFFKMLSESGLIGLFICIMAMASAGSKKTKEVKLKPKTEKTLIFVSLILIVTGLITAYIAI